MSTEPSVVVRAFPDDRPRRASSKSKPPAVTPGDGASYHSSKPRPLLQGESSVRMSPATMVSPEYDPSRRTAKSRPSRRRSSTSNRARRIKRTIESQRAADRCGTPSVADTMAEAITNAFIGVLSDIAKSFLYPEAETPEKEEKENKEAQDVSLTVSTVDTDDERHSLQTYDTEEEKEKKEAQDVSFTVSTVDTDDGRHSLQTYTEEGTADTSLSLRTSMESSVASSRTPPPTLVGSDGSAFVPSNVPMNVHRPIPKVCRVVSPLFLVDEDAKTSPIARMRAPPPPTLPPSVRSDETKSRKSIENIVAEKHQKWRRQIKMQRRCQQEVDDISLLTTCDPAPIEKGKKPANVFQRRICAPCAQVDDVVCEGDRSFDYDSSSDDSSGIESSVTDYSVAEENEAPPAPRKIALKAPGSPVPRLSSSLLATESGESEQSGIKDKNFIQIFIQEMSQDGMVLIWHGSQGNWTELKRPCGVVAHLKLGSTHADGVYEPPRLAWRKQDGSDGGDIDLFDIQSLETASYDMLGHYPFAIPGNSFFVALNNGSHVVFEAGSDAEARRFVHGLRWVVARLSFNLVVGNPLVSCELLSVPNSGKVLPQTPMEEALWSKAMNDVTNHLVDGMLKYRGDQGRKG